MCELGIRRFAEDLDVHCDGDAAFRAAMMEQFPSIRSRFQSVTRRIVNNLANSDVVRNNPRLNEAERKA